MTAEEKKRVLELRNSGKGAKAIGISGIDGHLIEAEKLDKDSDGNPVDIGYVGKIKNINTKVIEMLANDEYIPVIASAAQNEDDGLVDFEIDYFGYDVEYADVYLEGVLIATVKRGDFDKITKLDFEGKKSGNYTLDVVARDIDSVVLYKPYKVSFYYEGIEIPGTDVPDTGFFFQNLNLSKEDYLVTGLIVFFVLGIVAFSIVAKGSKR